MTRRYFSEGENFFKRETLDKEIKKLLNTRIRKQEQLEGFIKRYSELQSIISEEMAWKYINMTRYANEEKYAEDFNEYYANIISYFHEKGFLLNIKIKECKYFDKLDDDKYGNFKKLLNNEIEMFEEANIPLEIKEQELANKYGEINSKMIVEYNGEKYTPIQMRKFLKDSNREVRKEAWTKVNEVMANNSTDLQKLFDDLKELRIEIAKNKKYENYRDYMHDLKARFSYTPEDLYKFHEAVEKVVVPFLKELNDEKAKKLGLDSLRPWDLDASEDGSPLKPFSNGKEFFEKGLASIKTVSEEYGKKFSEMNEKGYLDLENRKGKAPGGYNYPLSESGASFIFMNAVGVHDDVVTLVHEAGHAMHSDAVKEEEIYQYKETPSEVAELASMSMELMSMDGWNSYYENEDDFIRSKKLEIKRTLEILPWAVTVDAFQHWIYLNPNHTVEERNESFAEIFTRFNPGVNWEGYEKELSERWLKQLHIFEVPFYYIEYAISQLGAIAIYRNFKKDRDSAIRAYDDFLKLGYSKSVEKIYETVGIKFDFSCEYVEELVEFIKAEYNSL